jgi:hypothetical protein
MSFPSALRHVARCSQNPASHRIAYFQGFPFPLDLIEGRIHREHVNVIMWVGYPIHWPCLAVNKLRVDHVWTKAIVLLITFPHLRFHPGLDRCHSLVNGFGDHLLDDLVLIDGQI